MANISPKLGELIDVLLDRNEFPADCRKLSEYFAERGFDISHSSLYAWKRGTQGIAESKKIKFANALGFNIDKFNAYLDDRISLEQLESEDATIPLSEKEVMDWVSIADPVALLYVQRHIAERLIEHFDDEFSTLESVLDYALNRLAETAIEESVERGARISQEEASAEALKQFSESSAVKIKDLELFMQGRKKPTSKQVERLAYVIEWEVEALEALIDRD